MQQERETVEEFLARGGKVVQVPRGVGRLQVLTKGESGAELRKVIEAQHMRRTLRQYPESK